jgi:hypothetical protein
MAWVKNKAQLKTYLMYAAVIFLVIGLPLTLWGANSWNDLLANADSAYAQQENTTAFYQGAVVDGLSTEARYASVNGTGSDADLTAETPTWDTTSEWDQVTLTTTQTDSKVYFNWNVTTDDLMGAAYEHLRIKTNGTKDYKITVQAVKYDGVDLTAVEGKVFDHVDNGSQVLYWNFTSSELLEIKATLDADATDELYYQIIFEGYDDTKLTTGDTIQFQFALSEIDNAFAWSHLQKIRAYGIIMGILCLFIGFASTRYYNPLVSGATHGYATKGARYYKNRKSRKSTRRR